MKYSLIASAIFGAVYTRNVPRLYGRGTSQQACQPLKEGVAPVPVPNTAEEFDSFYFYNGVARSVSGPQWGYDTVVIAANASVASSEYLRYIDLDSYDLERCLATCYEDPDCNSGKPKIIIDTYY
jgi:hypothetical protein